MRAEGEQHHHHQHRPDDPRRATRTSGRSGTTTRARASRSVLRRPSTAYEMWPPSSWPNGNRFSAVASRPNQAANAIGCMLIVVAVRRRARTSARSTPLKQQRLAQLELARKSRRASAPRRDRLTPTNSTGTATRNPAIGPAMPMSNSCALVGNRLPDADERAERAGQDERQPAGSRAATRRRGSSGRRSSARTRARRGSPGSATLYQSPLQEQRPAHEIGSGRRRSRQEAVVVHRADERGRQRAWQQTGPDDGQSAGGGRPDRRRRHVVAIGAA